MLSVTDGLTKSPLLAPLPHFWMLTFGKNNSRGLKIKHALNILVSDLKSFALLTFEKHDANLNGGYNNKLTTDNIFATVETKSLSLCTFYRLLSCCRNQSNPVI